MTDPVRRSIHGCGGGIPDTVYCVVLVFSSYTMSGVLMRFRNRGVHGGQQLFATQQELFY